MLVANRFAVIAQIGIGNMGTVYRAIQLPMGRIVALKLMHAEQSTDPQMAARFEREALVASQVDHPNTITIYDSGRTETGLVFIAMEYLDGESLATLLARQQRLPPRRALEIWIPVVRTMIAAHRRSIVHRDLKPDNVYVSRKLNEVGQPEEVIKVLDFGIAKLGVGSGGGAGGGGMAGGAHETLPGARLGTALYMAPEQLEGRAATKATDVYALMLMLVEMLTGRLPWGRSSDEAHSVLTMLRLVNPPKPLSVLCPEQVFSSELQRIVNACLLIAPDGRPQDAGELLRAMQHVPELQQLMGAGAGQRDSVGLPLILTASPSELVEAAQPGSVAQKAALSAPVSDLPKLGMDTLRTGVPRQIVAEAGRRAAASPGPGDVPEQDNTPVQPLPSAQTGPLLRESSEALPSPSADARFASRAHLDHGTTEVVVRRPVPQKWRLLGVALGMILFVSTGLWLWHAPTPSPGQGLPTPPDKTLPATRLAGTPPKLPSGTTGPTQLTSSPPVDPAQGPSLPAPKTGPSLAVTFKIHKPTEVTIRCGLETLHLCDKTCDVPEGAHCVASSPGHQDRSYDFAMMKKKEKRGRVRISVRLKKR